MSLKTGTSKINILAITACTTGVAHTYMAAEKLEKLAREYDFGVKIETQGVLGIKNKLSEKDIETTDLVIIAADIVIDNPDRFTGCRVINVRISSLLMNPNQVLITIKKILHYPKGKTIDI
ncbi:MULTISPECIES: PTS fructose transporter subunit IIB [Rahnella]|jgi:fructose-specific phosphotransferase system IIB component|uniref:protein-N(pi)-phosphohistidine--D-fructose phosphotransferase n=1 Tax=Rahnella contaminans TaxID=2703882 RepID=A0A6M2B447_9GAMM|nr:MULTISPECIES: PTS fructose transporter subunit IIB [Rahnella]KAB8311381.1 PTS glucitol transporter subunit IIA [Rouxiella chamberiensis]MBU9819118.1 PTS fructose transporter subunit IIB [Rahnella sp. BCC 1045]MCS3423159.1 fructose-specific phosphotransferase system IIB component [Rahnella sp. BIGb0603]MDF1894250.1 PTS fructose transporter subunit IIB [Rahnella contaminans]NGX87177.1 PTS glucitol transporter subunit IIA [Rahnella contaminans]